MQQENEKVKKFIKKERMIEDGDKILVGISGGADSVALLSLLNEEKKALGIELFAFHLNHQIRGAEADQDEAYVKNLCDRYRIPLTVLHEKVEEYAVSQGISTEEAGRILRYRHMRETAQAYGCNKIAVAHHKDDQAETVLMNLFRGTGLSGLSGIRPVREEIIRPFLCLNKEEIRDYLKQKGISWREDSTNLGNDYTRNRIRNKLIPWVQENVNRQAKDHVLELADFALQADTCLREMAEALLGEEKTKISTEVFDRQPPILKGYLVHRMISETTGKAKDITKRHVNAVCALRGPGGGTHTDLPYGLCAVRSYDTIKIIEKTSAEEETNPKLPKLFSRTFPWKKGMEIPKNQYTKWFDYDKIKFGLSVRTRADGDFLTIAKGAKKKLSRFLIDEKIPASLRDEIPLLADGSHILWVIGYRVSEEYKITDATKRVLEVCLKKPSDAKTAASEI